jgi:uncharacterized membrane protein YphA (DoxX/SURF4 family)
MQRERQEVEIVNITVWIIQGVLAAIFAIAGILKTTQPKEKLSPKLPWVNDFSISAVRFYGTAELLGAIGIIIPYLTGILPILTPLAALGLACMMLSAAIYHYGKREYKAIAFNLVLLILALVVAFSRD